MEQNYNSYWILELKLLLLVNNNIYSKEVIKKTPMYLFTVTAV